MTTPFPRSPTFMTIDEPFRFEGSLFDLEVEGTIPSELHGTFFRVGPDQQFPPKMGDANPFNGDGIVSAFRFKDGHVDMQHRYVRTHRFVAERAARRGCSAITAIRSRMTRASRASSALSPTRTSWPMPASCSR